MAIQMDRRQRRRCGRRSETRLALIDTQNVKCFGMRGPRGYDGAKKLVGRKRGTGGCRRAYPAARRRADQYTGSRQIAGPR